MTNLSKTTKGRDGDCIGTLYLARFGNDVGRDFTFAITNAIAPSKHFQILYTKRSRNSFVMILSLDQEQVYMYVLTTSHGYCIQTLNLLYSKQKV
jgi:hypothetical protein